MTRERFVHPPRSQESHHAAAHPSIEQLSPVEVATRETVERDLAEMNAQATERVAREAAEPDAATAAETQAREMATGESIARRAQNIQELRASSTGVYSPSQVLDNEFPFDTHPRSSLILFEISRLMGRYLGEDTSEPTLLTTALTATAPLERRQTTALQNVHRHLTTELQRKLHELAEAIRDESPAGHPLASPTALLERLSYGQIPRMEGAVQLYDQVETLVGATKRMAQAYHFPQINLETPAALTRLMIPEPFARDMNAHWRQEQKNYKERTLQGTVLKITEQAIADLILAAEDLREFRKKESGNPARTEEIDHAIRAYDRVIDWLQTQRDIIAALTDPEDFAAYMQTVTLFDDYSQELKQLIEERSNGEATAESVGLLPALNTLKNIDPARFAALCGLRAGEDVMNPQAELSDEFGNPLQQAMLNTPKRFALYKAKYAREGWEPYGLDRIEGFVANLPDVTVAQPEFLTLNPSQMRMIEARLKQAAREQPDGSFSTEAKLMFTAGVTLRELLPAYALQTVLSRIEREDREILIGRLRVAPPKEFIRRIKTLPQFLAHDREVAHILEERILSKHPDGLAYWEKYHAPKIDQDHDYSTRRGVITDAVDIVSLIKNKIPPEHQNHHVSYGMRDLDLNRLLDDLRIDLWQDVADEALLTRDFFADLQKKYKEGSEGEKVPIKKEQFLAIVNAHPEISKPAWRQWYSDCQHRQDRSITHNAAQLAKGTIIQPILADYIKTKSINDVLLGLFQQMTVEDIITSPSQVFELYRTIYKTDRPIHQLETTLIRRELDATKFAEQKALFEQPIVILKLQLQLEGEHRSIMSSQLNQEIITEVNQLSVGQLDVTLTAAQHATLIKRVRLILDFQQSDQLGAIPTNSFENSEVVVGQPTLLQFADKYCKDAPRYQALVQKGVYTQVILPGRRWKFDHLAYEEGQWVKKPFVRFKRIDDSRNHYGGPDESLTEANALIERFNLNTNTWEIVTKQDVPELSQYFPFQ